MDHVEIGRRLARLRKARGLTQDGVARRLDMTRNNYQNYETGRTRIPIEHLPRLAHALRMSKLAFMEYLGLIEKGEQTLDDFIRTQAPNLFLLMDANEEVGDESAPASITRAQGASNNTAAADDNRHSDGSSAQLPRAYHRPGAVLVGAGAR